MNPCRLREYSIAIADGSVVFGQLLGMCDHVTFPLGKYFKYMQNWFYIIYVCVCVCVNFRPSWIFGIQVCTLWSGRRCDALPTAASTREQRNVGRGTSGETASQERAL